MKLLITGAAGFIGYHLAKRLAKEKHQIVCIDNINEYYDIDLKYGRLSALGFERNKIEAADNDNLIASSFFSSMFFLKIDLCNEKRIIDLFKNNTFDIVLHLAAQAGVRYSLSNPFTYISSNIQGSLVLLEAAKNYTPQRFIYASSSSVYGLNSKIPFSEKDTVNHPASLYAATKASNELIAYTYSHLYKIPTTGIRFFTVYGPWGRPDMAPFIFTKSIIEEKPIILFNNGNMKRDFTYIDDVIEGIILLINKIPDISNAGNIPAAIYNIGNGDSVPLMNLVHILENVINKKAIIKYAPMQSGDVIETWADCSALERDTGFRPNTNLLSGIRQFILWYNDFYH